MSLKDSIITGKKLSPLRILIHGKPGAGKTKFLSELPNVLVFDLEKGFGELEAARIEPTSYSELKSGMTELKFDPMGYQSVAIDSFSRFLEMLDAHIGDQFNTKSAATVDYGRGIAAMQAELVSFLALLDDLRNKNKMHVVFSAHSAVKTFNPPDSTSYDRYEILGQEKLVSILIQWSDVIFFLKEEVLVRKDGGKQKATGTGRRLLISEDSPTHIAKSRYSIPKEITFIENEGWKAVSSALKNLKKEPKSEASN